MSEAVYHLLLKRFALLLLLASVGCSAQTTSNSISPQVSERVQHQVQVYFDLPPDVKITVGAAKPSEFPDYQTLPVTLSREGKTQVTDFLLSKDGKTLIRMTKLDLSKDPYQDIMSRIDVKGRPVRGNPNAKVTLINYDDFECPFCSRMHSTLMGEILPQYGDRIKIVYKDYPLNMHPWAPHAANDANCLAGMSDKAYWDFADYVHANQREISGDQHDLQRSFLQLDHVAFDMGKKYGADEPKLQACVKAQSDAAVKASMAEGDKLGVSATPTMFVNGEKLEGALDADAVRTALNQQLLAAGIQPPAPAAPPKPVTPSK